MAEEKDVDLFDELARALASDESEAKEKPPGASPEKPGGAVETPEVEQPKIDENAELTEEEISKLSPRAQKRIRDLAEEVKKLAEKPAEETPQEDPPAKKTAAQEFKSVEEFLAAVQDEPSRDLLSKFYRVIRGETSQILAPIEQKNNESRFEAEFSQYAEKVEGLADHKSDLRKTFLRNPNQSIKALVSELVLDLQLSKVKPLDDTPSNPNRSGKINTDNLTLDQLYDLQESQRPQ